jgi:hypothetical protein
MVGKRRSAGDSYATQAGRRVYRRQVEGHDVVYSVVVTKAKTSPGHEKVETHFEGELSEKQQQG